MHGASFFQKEAKLPERRRGSLQDEQDWLSVSSNRKGNLFTVLGRASDALSEDMSKSPSNFLRDTVAAGTVIALAPLSAILLIL